MACIITYYGHPSFNGNFKTINSWTLGKIYSKADIVFWIRGTLIIGCESAGDLIDWTTKIWIRNLSDKCRSSRAKTQKQAAKEKCAWPVMSNWPFLYLFVNYLDLYVILDSFGCTSRVGFQFEQGFVAFFTMWPFQWFMYKHVNCVHVHELWMNEELKWCCRNIWKLFQELRLATRFWLWRLGGLLNWNTFWAPGIMSVPSDQGREVDHPEARNTGSEGGPGLYWAHNHNGRQQSYDGRPMKQWLCLRACLNIVRTGTFVPTVLI